MTVYIEQEYKRLGISLESSSGGRWRSVCPFPNHLDNDPSFVVYPDGTYHCYGCRAHGTLQKIAEYFLGEDTFSLSRIDLSMIGNDDYSKLLTDQRKKIEIKLRSSLKDVSMKKKFSVYDKFDRVWIKIRNKKFSSKLDVCLDIRKVFTKILQ